MPDGHTVVVAGGGDGTINAVAAALIDTDAALGVLPLGTLNHFAKDLRIPLDAAGAAAVIAGGASERIDVGEVNGRIFVNNSSIGIYPSVVAERERLQEQGQPKWIALGVAFSRIWWRYRHLHASIAVGASTFRATTPFVFVGNNEYQLQGLHLGARESLTAGRMQVCLAPRTSRIDLIRIVGAAIAGHLDGNDTLEAFVTTECSIQASHRSLLVSTDGEVTRMRSPLRYRIRPRALRVLVPPPAPEAAR